MFNHNPINITGERSVPLLLGLASVAATYYILANYLGGSKARGS